MHCRLRASISDGWVSVFSPPCVRHKSVGTEELWWVFCQISFMKGKQANSRSHFFVQQCFCICLLCILGFISMSCFFSSSVYGSSEAALDASETPARLHLPAPRPAAQGPPLHLPAGGVPGPPLDPQVHRGCHHLPCHGRWRSPSPSAARAFPTPQTLPQTATSFTNNIDNVAVAAVTEILWRKTNLESWFFSAKVYIIFDSSGCHGQVCCVCCFLLELHEWMRGVCISFLIHTNYCTENVPLAFKNTNHQNQNETHC